MSAPAPGGRRRRPEPEEARRPEGRKRRGRISPPRDLAPGFKFRLIGILGAALIRLWGPTLRIEWLNRENLDAIEREGERVCYALWHGTLLPLAYTHRSRGIVILVSRHKDGEIISQIICRLGYGVARGSTSREGLQGLRAMARAAREGHPLGITPDGPRGPRRRLQPGLLQIARLGGVPVVPVAIEARRKRVLESWDRFMIPHPWSRVAVVTGPMIRIPAEAAGDDLERQWVPRVDDAMRQVQEQAERWLSERSGRRG